MDAYRAFLVAIVAALPACTEEGTACLEVPADQACPEPEDVDKDALQGGCGSKIRKVLGPGEKVDNVSDWGGTDGAIPGCCYPVKETKPDCVYGRPLVVEGQPVVAAAVETPGWAEQLALRCAEAPPAVRAALVERWTTAALDEHASIAAFSRVALDLLRHAAPPELVEQAHAAALDEVRHARRGFAIASAIAGERLGPGPFPIGERVELAPDLAAVAADAALHGCIGETVAALLAREAAALCEEPTIRAVLLGIAEDEERHALLGWRTAAWALREGGAAVRERLARVFAGAAREGVAVPLRGACDDPVLLARVGLLDRETSGRAAAEALRRVILPAARTLLAGAVAGAAEAAARPA